MNDQNCETRDADPCRAQRGWLGQQTATDRAIANHQAMASRLKQFAHDQIRIEGPLVTRWLPLTSAAVIMILGLAIAARSLMTGGILQIRV